MKKILLGIFTIAWAAVGALSLTPAHAQTDGEVLPSDDKTTISVFVRDDCKHCKDEKAFLAELEKDPNYAISLNYYDLQEEKNLEMFSAIAKKYSLIAGTPITLVNGTLIQGYGTEATTGETIKELLEKPQDNRVFEDILEGGADVHSGFSVGTTCSVEGCEVERPSYKITLPFIGKTIDVGKFSLAGLSLTLGLVDGFNPCALWVLIMFIMILAQLGDRKKMFEYIGIFIIAEAIMYYLILNVWFSAWNFIALNNIVTPIIGLLAVGSGIYFFYKFITYSPVCKVASLEQQQKISSRVKELAKKNMSVGVFFGILGLAFSVNIFEFACSIGIPQTFTKILEINHLTFLQEQWYMFLYILMFIFDDLIVFGIALYSMEKIGLTHKYSKWSTLIGAILMVALGLIMLIKPELLIF